LQKSEELLEMAKKPRKKMGRPPMLEQPVNFTIRIDKSLLERAREAAWDSRTTLSEYVREALTRLAAGKGAAAEELAASYGVTVSDLVRELHSRLLRGSKVKAFQPARGRGSK
jgi:hypothetical protein